MKKGKAETPQHVPGITKHCMWLQCKVGVEDQ